MKKVEIPEYCEALSDLSGKLNRINPDIADRYSVLASDQGGYKIGVFYLTEYLCRICVKNDELDYEPLHNGSILSKIYNVLDLEFLNKKYELLLSEEAKTIFKDFFTRYPDLGSLGGVEWKV